MKTNYLKASAILAIAFTSLVSCEKAEMVVPQELENHQSVGKKKSIMDGDALALDPDIAPEPENPVVTKGKKRITHFHDAVIEELQEAAPGEPRTIDGINQEESNDRNRNKEDGK